MTSPEITRLDREMERMQHEKDALPPVPASPTNGYHSAIETLPDVAKWVQVDLGRTLPIDRIRLFPARPTDFADTPGFGFPTEYRVAVSDDPTFERCYTVADTSGKEAPNPGDTVLSFTVARKARYVRVTALRLWRRTND